MATNAVVSACDSFASRDVTLNNNRFRDILNFFGPEELVLLEKVCTSWKTFIDATGQWKKHCQDRLNIPAHIDPKSFLREGWNYKKGALLASPKVFDRRMYQYYLGADVGPVPPIPEEISLERGGELDPCGSTKTIGQNYTWFYCSEDFTLEDPSFELDKPDDPNDEEAPRLIKQEAVKSEEKRVLKILNTINNIGEIFKHPKNGNPSVYNVVWNVVANQHGNKRVPSGWICMREDVVGRRLSFSEQQAAASKRGFIIPPLLHRIIFDLLKHVSSERSNTYPDGQNPWTYARTSTLIHTASRISSACCGAGGPSGLNICHSYFAHDNDGVAVVLPLKVQAMDT